MGQVSGKGIDLAKRGFQECRGAGAVRFVGHDAQAHGRGTGDAVRWAAHPVARPRRYGSRGGQKRYRLHRGPRQQRWLHTRSSATSRLPTTRGAVRPRAHSRHPLATCPGRLRGIPRNRIGGVAP